MIVSIPRESRADFFLCCRQGERGLRGLFFLCNFAV